MKKPIILNILCALAISLFAHQAITQEGYTLKEGDLINISVWGEEMNQTTLVLPDGSISFPLVGSISVINKTSQQVEAEITEALSDYIPGPEVSVVITNTEGNRVYVLGKVRSPGLIVMNGPMTVVQALSLSGGLDTFADENSIRVLRWSGSGQVPLEVRYNDILSAKNLSTNHLLKAGDTIIVP